MKKIKLLILVLFISLIQNEIIAQTCTFNGNGDGVSWDDDANWSCGSEPSVSDVVVIPDGFSVTHDADFNYTGSSITINGAVDFGAKKLKIKGTPSALTIGSTGGFTGKELSFESTSTGIIASGASVDVEDFKTKNFAAVEINAACISVTNKIENKDVAEISTSGSGCIDFSGSNYTNSSPRGIFGCTSGTAGDCVNISTSSSEVTFDGGGDGTNWSDADNWDGNTLPDTDNENVTIPVGFAVDYDLGGNLEFKNSTVFTICGSIALGSSHLHMKNNSSIAVCNTGTVTGHEIKLENSSTGTIENGASITLEQIEVKNSGVFTINAECPTITDELKNKNSGTITGTGCLDFSGGTFENTGSGGIFSCTESAYNDCDFGLVTLPVELGDFGAQIINDEIIVSWETFSEINNSHFEVWVGSDNGGFYLMKTVPGKGNSADYNSYTTGFKPVISGVLYIKIKQVDFGGMSKESEMIALIYTPSLTFKNIDLFPNPANNKVSFKNLKADEPYTLSVYSNDGKFQYSSMVSLNNNSIDISELKVGSYFIKLEDKLKNSFVLQFIKTN